MTTIPTCETCLYNEDYVCLNKYGGHYYRKVATDGYCTEYKFDDTPEIQDVI